MRSTAIQLLLESIDEMSMTHTERLSDALKADRSRRGQEVLATGRSAARRHCGSLKVARNWYRGELQCYFCRNRAKTSNATTGTQLARLRRREGFEAYARCLAKSLTVRQPTKACSLFVSTAHPWRLRSLVEHPAKTLSGFQEVRETYFCVSPKHSTAVERPPRYHGGEGARWASKESGWAPVLIRRLCGQTIVCAEGDSPFLSLDKDLGVAAKSQIAASVDRVIGGAYRVQFANSYRDQIRSWVNRQLRGVTTKKLPLYRAWMRLPTCDASGLKPFDSPTSALRRAGPPANKNRATCT